MTTTEKKLELKLNEDNELSFKLSIEGTVSDPELASPKFRFTVTELGDGTHGDRGWIFPARKEADDIVTVSIPAPLKTGFKPNRVYKGTLEVILGRLYFSPAEMQLEFSTPLEIQAEIATVQNEKKEKPELLEHQPKAAKGAQSPHSKSATAAEGDDFDEEEIMSVISEEQSRKTQHPEHQRAPKVLMALPSTARAHQKIQEASKVKPATTQMQHPPPHRNKKTERDNDLAQKNQLKARLMSMFKEALVPENKD